MANHTNRHSWNYIDYEIIIQCIKSVSNRTNTPPKLFERKHIKMVENQILEEQRWSDEYKGKVEAQVACIFTRQSNTDLAKSRRYKNIEVRALVRHRLMKDNYRCDDQFVVSSKTK